MNIEAKTADDSRVETVPIVCPTHETVTVPL